MSFSASTIVSILESYILEYMNIPYTLPPNERLFAFWVIILIATAFAFIGRRAYRYILLIVGGILGWFSSYFFAQFILSFVVLPSWLISIIGILLGASFMFFLARISISAGIAIMVYYVASTIFAVPTSDMLYIIAIVFIVSMFVYKRALNYIAPILGGILLYYAMTGLGMNVYESLGGGVVLAGLGIALYRVVKSRTKTVPVPVAPPEKAPETVIET